MSLSANSIDYDAVAPDFAQSRDGLLTLANALSVKSFGEVGVWKGGLAARILEGIPSIETYWMIDPWRNLDDWNKPFNVEQTKFDAVHREAMEATAFAEDKRRVLRGTTTEVIDEIPDGTLDMAYIDGDHTLRGITIDLMLIWPKLRPGGLLTGDDSTPTIWQHGAEFEPTLVFPFVAYFAEAMRVPLHCFGSHQFAIPKPDGAPAGYKLHDHTGRYSAVELLPMIQTIPKRRNGLAGRLKRRLKALIGA